MHTLELDPGTAARIFLDDRIVAVEERMKVRPEPGQILTVRVIPAGGANGSKDTAILDIVVAAVAAAATWYAGGTGGLLASSSFFSASQGGLLATNQALGYALLSIAGGIAGESVKLLGGLAINSLIPPPRTPVPKQETTPHSYTVSGTANAAAPFSPIPKIYGQRRIFPQYAASPYNELAGFNQYLRMLFLLGYGPLDISQIKIGDTAIEDYEDVEWELRASNTVTRDGYRQYHPSGDDRYRFTGHNSAELSAEVIPSEIGSSQPALNSSFATRIAFSSRVTQLVHTGSSSVSGFSHSDGSGT